MISDLRPDSQLTVILLPSELYPPAKENRSLGSDCYLGKRPDKISAKARVGSILLKIIRTAAVIGTAKNAPGTPQTKAQKTKEPIIVTGCKSIPLPKSFGSKMLPITNCIQAGIISIIQKLDVGPNCIKAIGRGKSTAIIEPTLGIKFNIIVATMNIKESSSPTAKYTTPTQMPVNMETIICI